MNMTQMTLGCQLSCEKNCIHLSYLICTCLAATEGKRSHWFSEISYAAVSFFLIRVTVIVKVNLHCTFMKKHEIGAEVGLY